MSCTAIEASILFKWTKLVIKVMVQSLWFTCTFHTNRLTFMPVLKYVRYLLLFIFIIHFPQANLYKSLSIANFPCSISNNSMLHVFLLNYFLKLHAAKHMSNKYSSHDVHYHVNIFHHQIPHENIHLMPLNT